ncbi:ABC transporter permease [Mycoplasmatota bacterium]|nr:ABC transporter permease [Mycoplasmatota bacterium]
MADENIKKTDESLEKDQFQFVQKEEKIYDKKFQTKPIGYFKDAMIRFARNKTNVIATTILGTLILLSVFVPILSSKNAEALESQLAHLPPRMPILENFGIADGTSEFEEIPISYDNPYINEETGEPYLDPVTGDPLYLPEGEYSRFIEEGTLINYVIECNDADEGCEGGFVQLSKGVANKPVAFYSTAASVNDTGETVFNVQTFTGISSPTEAILELKLDINNAFNDNVFNGRAEVVAYLQANDAEKTMVKIFDSSDSSTYDSLTDDGIYTVEFSDLPDLDFDNNNYKFVLSYDSNIKDSVVIDYIRLSARRGNTRYGDQGPFGRHLIYADGYELSNFALTTDVFTEDNESVFVGSVLRVGGERLTASYTVDSYAKAFGPVLREGFPGSEFLELVQGCTYADGTAYDVDDPQPGLMSDDCAIYELVSRNDEDAVNIGGEIYYTYDVYLNYRVYAGYDEIPYYLFGTSAAGFDMVKLIWIGLRTSLLIGLLVSFINIAIGVVYGAISGYYGGQVDIIMQRFAEIIGRIPWLVTLSIMMAYFEAGFTSLILILIISGWIGVASITRTQFYRYKGREYVLASRTLGAKDGRLIFRHILPNGIGTIITSSILLIPTVIFSEATLSYLGFGIGHGQSFKLFGLDALELSGVSIGVLLNDGRNKLRNYPHLTIFPAIIISILMITFNMFGNALRDAFNPALRGSE